jgi:WD40 repeat protein
MTPTDRWDDRALELTPFLFTGEEVTSQNIQAVRELAVWGTGRANDIVLSPDGLILAVGTNIGVYLYDSLTYELITLLPTRSPVHTIAFSIENLWVALGESGGYIEVFDFVALTPVVLLRHSQGELPDSTETTLSFSDGSDHLTSVIKTAEKIYVHQWHTSDWHTTSSFTLDEALISYINPDIDLLGVFSEKELHLQSLSHQDEYQVIPLTGSVSGLFWNQISTFKVEVTPSRDGDFILMNKGNTIIHWEIRNEHITYRLDDYPTQLPDPCYNAPDTCLNTLGGFSWECSETDDIPSIEMIALTPDDVMVLISTTEDGSEFRRASDGLLSWEIKQTFTDVTFSPGSEFFFGTRPDGVIEKRRTLDGELISLLERHPSQLYDLAFSHKGTILAVGFNDKFIRIYDVINGNMLGVLTGSARSLAFSPDDRLLAGGLNDGTIRIFELDSGRYYDIAPGHQGAITDLAFSLNGEHLLSVSADCTISVWKLGNRSRIENFIPKIENPFQITEVEKLSNSNINFISGNRNGIYLLKDTELLDVLIPSESKILDLTLSPDGRYLGAINETILSIADLTAPLYTFDSHPVSEGYALAFSLDSSIVTLATLQGLEFWSVEDGVLLSKLPLHETLTPEGKPAAFKVSPDGSMIALGTQDELIHVFGLP